MNFIRLIPSWVWVALGIALMALGIGKAIGSYLDMTRALESARKDISNLVTTNSSLAADNRTLIKDMRDRAKVRETIEEDTKKSNVQFDDLDGRLQAAIVERDALEAAVAGTEAAKEQQDNVPVGKNTSPVKPVVQPAKKPVEINILWEAYCLDATSPKCTQAK